MNRSPAPPARGVLKTPGIPGHHQRWLPAADLRAFIEHFWSVSWDLRGHSAQQVATLPHPSVHWVFERGLRSEIAGVHTDRFVRELRDQGEVFGIKFRPGGFYAFYPQELNQLSNCRVSAMTIFGEKVAELEASLARCDDVAQRITIAEEFLRACAPRDDTNLTLLSAVIDVMASDKNLLKVEHVAERFVLSTRQLQRLFLRYVGVTPKWVLQRYRLHEALAQLNPTIKPDWAQLALQLGYSDQAHFVNDFKSSTGFTPQQYWQR